MVPRQLERTAKDKMDVIALAIVVWPAALAELLLLLIVVNCASSGASRAREAEARQATAADTGAWPEATCEALRPRPACAGRGMWRRVRPLLLLLVRATANDGARTRLPDVELRPVRRRADGIRQSARGRRRPAEPSGAWPACEGVGLGQRAHARSIEEAAAGTRGGFRSGR